MTKMLAHTIVLLLVLAGCGSADTDGDSFDSQQEGVQDAIDSVEGADQKAGDATSAETEAEGQSADDDGERADSVFHAHVPRLPE